MGCDSSHSLQEENKNIITTENLNMDENSNEVNKSKKQSDKEEVVNKEGNKANKDNRKNKKDQRKKRDMKNQQEFIASENDNSLSNSDSYKIKKKKKSKNVKKKDNSEKSEDEEENKEINSNINTEGMATVETGKLNYKKKKNEGLILMDGVEDLIPEELTEEDIYQLVQDALADSIVEKEEDKVPGTITRKQARSISSLLYKKLKNKKGKHNIDISDYPELEGLNIKIGAGQLTKDVVKNMMFNDEQYDQSDIDKTYAKFTKKTNDVKALTIELIVDEEENNEKDKDKDN